jgi:hypothetical protein
MEWDDATRGILKGNLSLSTPVAEGGGGPTKAPPALIDSDEVFDRVVDRLTVIRGYSELLLEGTFGPITADQRRILTELLMEADDLHSIIHIPASHHSPRRHTSL